MKPVFQTKFGGSDAPAQQQDNCVQAAIASLLEVSLEDVPDFGGGLHTWRTALAIQEWLSDRGLCLLILPVNSPALEYEKEPDYYLAAVASTTLKNPDDGHIVVMRHGQQVVHDPNPHAKSIGQVLEYWILVGV